MTKIEIKRSPGRGWTPYIEIEEFVRSSFTCQIAFVDNDLPYVIPMFFVYFRNGIVIHGSKASRLINILKRQAQVCVSIMEEDGLVLAKSAFHHSMNYRSVMVFGSFKKIVETHNVEKVSELMVEKMQPGRWEVIRKPSEAEYAQTEFLHLSMENYSAKKRKGGPNIPPYDSGCDAEAGEIKITKTFASKMSS